MGIGITDTKLEIGSLTASLYLQVTQAAGYRYSACNTHLDDLLLEELGILRYIHYV